MMLKLLSLKFHIEDKGLFNKTYFAAIDKGTQR